MENPMYKKGNKFRITGEMSGPYLKYKGTIVTIKGIVVENMWFYVEENEIAWCRSELTFLPELTILAATEEQDVRGFLGFF